MPQAGQVEPAQEEPAQLPHLQLQQDVWQDVALKGAPTVAHWQAAVSDDRIGSGGDSDQKQQQQLLHSHPLLHDSNISLHHHHRQKQLQQHHHHQQQHHQQLHGHANPKRHNTARTTGRYKIRLLDKN